MQSTHRVSVWMASAAVVCCLAACASSTSVRTTPAEQSVTFTTLGTNSGPIPNPRRAEPSNLLRVGSQHILVDAGDGAAWQLSKAGSSLRDVRAILISHLHFDHTGGLFAVLSQRYQMIEPSGLAIYGPPGTEALVQALITAINHSVEGASNMRGFARGTPGENIRVIELGDGTQFALGDVKVTAVRNTHFVASKGGDDPRSLSLSFRFDAPGRSIVYTGDTGPSPAVEELARGADLLFCEIMDPELALKRVGLRQPDASPQVKEMISAHFHREHMSPSEAGLLASRAGVKQLILTHNALPDDAITGAGKIIASHYQGPFEFAEDLDRF